jgi:hypothetical protein
VPHVSPFDLGRHGKKGSVLMRGGFKSVQSTNLFKSLMTQRACNGDSRYEVAAMSVGVTPTSAAEEAFVPKGA